MTAFRRMTGKAFGGAMLAAALAVAFPAGAQNTDAPVDVTAAPPPSAETVGPSQLRDFNLQGTVTRPAERPAPSSQPAPTAAQPGPSAANGDRGTALPTPEPRAARPATSLPATAEPSSRVADQPPAQVATLPSPQGSGGQVAVPAPAPGFAPATEPLMSTNSRPDIQLPWPWIAALLALVAGAGIVLWSRRHRLNDPGRAAFAGLAREAAADPSPTPATRPVPQPRALPRPDPVPPKADVQPRAQPRPAATPASPTKSDGRIVSTGLRPDLNVQFQPDRTIVTDSEVLVQFDVLLVNNGSAAARDVLVEGILVAAHAGQDQQIGKFFQSPIGKGDRIAAIPPLGRISLKSVVRLPIEQLHSFEAGGRRLFVPLVAFNILFRSNAGEDQVSASFLVGRGSEEDEKLAPFRLDLGPRIFRGLSARPHSLGLQKVA